MDYAIYTFGGGEIIHGVLNAVAMCLNSKSGSLYQPLIMLGLIVGGMWAVLYALYNNSVQIFTSWIIPMTVIMGMLFVPTARVNVIEKTTQTNYPVDHVPYGLAMFASYISTIGAGITEQVEKIFNTPDSLQYQKTGYVFASRLMEQAKTFHITNEDLAENMRQFVGQCVVYDAMLGRKYTLMDLRHSDDLWGLVSSHASPVRSFLWRDLRQPGSPGNPPMIISCRDGVQRFNKVWKTELDQAAGIFGQRMFGKKPLVKAKVELLQHLPIAHNALTQLGRGASEILQQQMMIYAVIDGIEQQSVAVGNSPNFATRRAYLQQRATHETLGGMAADLLPIMKAGLEAVTYALFIFVLPLSLLPFGWRFLSIWGQIVLWLQMWPPVYAILNYIMLLAATSKTQAAMSLSTDKGITIASSLGIMNANADMSALAGYLAMSVPMLCLLLVRGVSSYMSSATSIASVSQGAATMAASEATSGNYSFGNVSEGNMQIANTNMLQSSQAASYRSGSFQLADGHTDMLTAADGTQIANVSTSNLPVSLSVSENQSTQLSEMAGRSEQNALNYSESSGRSFSSSFRDFVDFNKAISNNQNLSDAMSHGENSEHGKAISKANNYIKDFAKAHHIGEEQAANIIGSASAQAGLNLFGNGASVSATTNIIGTGVEKDQFDHALKMVESKDFQESMRDAVQASKSLSHTLNDEKSKRLAEGFSGSYEKGVSERNEAAKSFRHAEDYNKQANHVKSMGSAINAVYTQEFFEWLSHQRADQTDGHIGKHGAAHIMANQPEMRVAYAQRFMEEKGLNVKAPTEIVSARNSIKNSYDNESGHRYYAATNEHMETARQRGVDAGVSFNEHNAFEVRDKASYDLLYRQGEIQLQKTEVTHNSDNIKSDYDQAKRTSPFARATEAQVDQIVVKPVNNVRNLLPLKE